MDEIHCNFLPIFLRMSISRRSDILERETAVPQLQAACSP